MDLYFFKPENEHWAEKAQIFFGYTFALLE